MATATRRGSPSSPELLDPKRWSDPWWRLSNLYHIIDDDGRSLKFVPNQEQSELYHAIWWLNCVLKARQMGFTTFIDLMALDQCIFNENFQAAVICHNLDDARKIFRRKILHPWNKLPKAIRDACPLVKENESELVWKNGSAISVTTSARSGTFQFLHVSELGKIARRFPEKAREIVSGSFEAVPIGKGKIFVESTAEGNAGQFFDMVETAQKLVDGKKQLGLLDFRLHFFPWWRKASNRLSPHGVYFSQEDRDYFKKLKNKHGIDLDQEQKAWWVKKRESLKRDMKREHPSFPGEAFEVAVDGAIYAEEMAVLRRRGQIGRVPLVDGPRVNTFWDLGQNDATAIILHQTWGGTDRFIKFFGDSGKGLRYWWEQLEEYREENVFKWGTHYLPHDGKSKLQLAEVQSRIDILEELGAKNVQGLPRVTDIDLGIQLMRRRLPTVYIDEENCVDLIKALDNYQYEWDEAAGKWKTYPLHNWCSNPCDAVRQWAQGYSPSGPMSGDEAGKRRAAQSDAETYRGGY